MFEDAEALTTAKQVLAYALKHGTHVTMYTDGSFAAMCESYEHDTRLCITYRSNQLKVTLHRIYGYDADKHMWTRPGREICIELPRRETGSMRAKYAELRDQFVSLNRTLYLVRDADQLWRLS